jgi:predicted dehydrogenase
MGPYYLTALVVLLGPVRRVTGSARISFPERTITSEPMKGKVVKVEVPTHVAGVLDFASGAVATLIMSFDVWSANLPRIEIYGSEASLSVPDPNGFGGPVRLRAKSDDQWREMELPFPYVDNSRGIGVAEMARAIASDRPHRAAGELAYHVLDVMHALHEASDRGRHVVLESSCERPEPLPVGLALGQLPD